MDLNVVTATSTTICHSPSEAESLRHALVLAGRFAYVTSTRGVR